MRTATATFASVNPKTGARVFVSVGDEYADDDELVTLFPWAFESGVESATAVPGEKRAVRKPAAKKPAAKKPAAKKPPAAKKKK